MGEDGGEVVLKIIPISSGEIEGEEEEMPYMSEAAAVRREIEVSQLLGGENVETGEEGMKGFVRFKGCVVLSFLHPSRSRRRC
jgi:hypothetical protein